MLLLLGAVLFFITFCIGIGLLDQARHTMRDAPDVAEVYRVAGLFTLKPFVTAPFWVMVIFMINDSHYSRLLAFVPGMGISLILILGFRAVVTGVGGRALLPILVLDTLRWSIGGILVLTFISGDISTIGEMSMLVSLILPVIVALVARARCRQIDALPSYRPSDTDLQSR